MSEKLLPCPFCGESKNLIVHHCEGTIIHPAYRIYCDNCGGSNGYTDRADHVESWNRRAAQPTIPEGWQLVPKEPTKEMRDVITSGIRHDHMVSVYQAMLAAAPKFGEEQ